MMEVKGILNSAKIFTDNVEKEALDQIKYLCDQEWAKDSQIRVMPDTHAGKGCTIGTTMTLHGKVCPNVCGVDIGCGMMCVLIGNVDIDFEKLDTFINENIPSGFHIRGQIKRGLETFFDVYPVHAQFNMDRALKSIGTLGGGNHFIEVDKGKDGNKYLVIHTGSRNFGKEVADYYTEQAILQHKNNRKEEIESVVKWLKNSGQEKEIQDTIERIKQKYAKNAQEYVEGDLFYRYIHDMEVAQKYAWLNRTEIAIDILEYMGWGAFDFFHTVHNYIDTENMILRKGAVSAKVGEKLLIPINMRDGSLICLGKGNKDWNESAPHGAGRLCSRSKAKSNFSVEDYKSEMDGIWSTSVCEETIDECPMAYKSKQEIVDNIKDTATIIDELVPLYNFKAK